MDNRTLVKWVGWWMFNVCYEDFTAFFCRNGLKYKSTIDEHWNAMRENPMKWWLDLDEHLQQSIIDEAIKKYSK